MLVAGTSLAHRICSFFTSNKMGEATAKFANCSSVLAFLPFFSVACVCAVTMAPMEPPIPRHSVLRHAAPGLGTLDLGRGILELGLDTLQPTGALKLCQAGSQSSALM